MISATDKGKPLIGRAGGFKEKVEWFPSRSDVEGIIRSFAVESRKHQSDMQKLIGKIVFKE